MSDLLEEDAEDTAETMGNTGMSKFVRVSAKDKIEHQLELKTELAERMEKVRKDYPEDVETLSTEEVEEKFDLE